MAPGYVLALVLEIVGAAGTVLALVLMRAERRSRSAELRGFLRSGAAGTPAAGEAGGRPSARRPIARVVDLPVVLPQGGAATARAALQRAFTPRPAHAVAG